ncbi:hypothetical protein MesoLj131c_63430 [Mesorhizobium sp. 131-3-5]|uniref:hypothetical protein n=1 Tax=Mesorhizobium sp. 131-3-5 TaxID=2744520 RepID=UPI0019295B01|nr:hypothetical protein [Mesorhizobium sp. 131-3-5]BCH12085.1 hypothetical protein MesoLj131c_63430 [Mesorhizobium sp. 131-3-5]
MAGERHFEAETQAEKGLSERRSLEDGRRIYSAYAAATVARSRKVWVRRIWLMVILLAFAKGLATYQKVVAANYMAHREVYGALRQVLLGEASNGFVVADLACGTAPGSAAALAGSKVARYIGIDIS